MLFGTLHAMQHAFAEAVHSARVLRKVAKTLERERPDVITAVTSLDPQEIYDYLDTGRGALTHMDVARRFFVEPNVARMCCENLERADAILRWGLVCGGHWKLVCKDPARVKYARFAIAKYNKVAAAIADRDNDVGLFDGEALWTCPDDLTAFFEVPLTDPPPDLLLKGAK